jgi:hypothetical protein
MAVSNGNGLGKVSEISSHPGNIRGLRQVLDLHSIDGRRDELAGFGTQGVTGAFGEMPDSALECGAATRSKEIG